MKRGLYYILAGFIFLLPGYKAYCQKILYPEWIPPDVRWFNFNIQDGREGETTLSIIQDSEGFIWCGNDAGLYRFDGINYKAFGFGEDSDSTLSGLWVMSILEDSEGTIWAGTYGALNRIDNKSGKVSHFYPEPADFADFDNNIRLIREDINGHLWIITDENVFSFDRHSEKFRKYPVDSLAWRSGVWSFDYEEERFLSDSLGKVWIATDNGLYYYNPAVDVWKKIYPAEGFSGGPACKILCVKSDLQGNIWCGTEGNGLVRILDSDAALSEEVKLMKKYPGPEAITSITDIYCDPTGILWLFGQSTLFRYDPVGGSSASYFLSDKFSLNKFGANLGIHKIFGTEDGELWLVNLTSDLLFRFIPSTEKISIYFFPRFWDFACICDNTGNFWVGAIASNMFRLVIHSLPFTVQEKIPHITEVDMLNKTRLAEDASGQLWMALSNGLFIIRKFDISCNLIPEKTDLPGGNIKPVSVFCDSNNKIWVGCQGGNVFEYDPSGKLIRKLKMPLNRDTDEYYGITIIRENSRGDIVFGHATDGIFILKKGTHTIEKLLNYNELAQNNSEKYLLDLLTDDENNIWIATFDGLFKANPDNGEITDYTALDGTRRNYGSFYYRIAMDRKKRIWILNAIKGPYLFNKETGTFSKAGIREEMYGLNYTEMIFDKYDRLWYLQNDNINIFNPDNHISQQIKINKATSSIQTLRLRSGKILFLDNSNLLIFPEDIPQNKIIPPVYITNIMIDGREINRIIKLDTPVTGLERIDLGYRQNNIRIEFAALNYLQPRLNKYRCFLNGVDKDTTVASTEQYTEYKNLRPGKYTFWVTGSNNDGFWNPEGVNLDIIIHPPFYKSAMAYIFYILLFISLIVIYVRIRISRLLNEKMRLEFEVSQRTSELKVKNLQLEEADKTKTRFFTNIAHEIRTPLSMILAPLDKLISEQGDDEKESSIFELIKRNGQRLMQLVNQLLDISRLDSGKMKIILTETDIVKSIRILVYEFLSIAESKNIRYLVEVPDKEFITLIDIDKTEKIISNLLSNAFKFTPSGGTVSCFIRTEKEEAVATSEMLEIRIKDTGPGISAEHIGKIFDRFYRVENHFGKDGAGTGIGLALTQEFVSILHGTVDVNSVIGKGTEFRVLIPLGKNHLSKEEYIIAEIDDIDRQKPHMLHEIAKAHKSDEARERENKITVLVIEDNDDLRNFIKESFSEYYHVLEAEDGKEGASLALTMIPDLVITDLMMPGMDGVSLCSLLKNDERTSHIPVIMLTAKATQEERIEGLKTGADDYITKPFNMTELQVRISNLLEQREKLRIKYRNHFTYRLQDVDSASVDDRFMDKIYSIIRDNIRDFNFDTGSLHERAGMSRVHLFRKLKAITGIPPGTLIRNIRLETGARYLLGNAGNITEISNSVGISNPSYFTKCFKKYFGVSPKDYAASVREKK